MKYQGLYQSSDGRMGWFDITEQLYNDIVSGKYKTSLCKAVRII